MSTALQEREMTTFGSRETQISPELSELRKLLSEEALLPYEHGLVRVTPVRHFTALENGVNIAQKDESEQETGAYKVRVAAAGAIDAINKNPDRVAECGFIAASTGNHAQAIAAVAQKLKCRAVVFMPENASQCKIDATRTRGAEVVLQGSNVGEALEAAEDYAKRSGAVTIHPFEGEHVARGNYSIGAEIYIQVPDAKRVFVGEGGGGAKKSIASALADHNPEAVMYGVKVLPEDSEEAERFVPGGELPELMEVNHLADAIAVTTPSAANQEAARQLGAGTLFVSEERLGAALQEYKIRGEQVEASGALALAGAKLLHELHPEYVNEQWLVVKTGSNANEHSNSILRERYLEQRRREIEEFERLDDKIKKHPPVTVGHAAVLNGATTRTYVKI